MADGKVTIQVILDDKDVGKGTKKVEGTLKGIGNTAKSGIATVGKLAGALGLVALAHKGINMVKDSLDGAIDRYDTLNNFPRVMEQIGFDAESSQRAIDKLSDGIQGLPTRLDEVASTAQSIAIMTGDLDGAVDTTLALNNAFLASGASTADAERGLQQYVQMLSKGEVDLQSWRTLQETMPFALRETAEAFGFTGESATNDFYEALKSGEITMSEFNDKLIELDQAQGGFAETAQTASGGIKTAWTNMKTWVVMGVTDIIEAIDEAMGGVGSIEGAINALKPVVQGVFGFIADTAIPAVGKAVGWVRDRFNDLKPTFNTVITALQPLIAVFEETQAQLQGQLSPILDNLKELFFSLLPILQMVATVIGGVLVTAIVIWTTIMNGAYRAIGPLISALINLVDFVVNVVNTVIALLTGDFAGALEFWNAATESSVQFFMNLWDAVVGFVMGIVESVIAWFEILYMTLVGNSIIPDMVEAIVEWFQNMFQWVIDIVMGIVEGIVDSFINIYETVSNYVQMIWEIITSVWDYIKDTFKNALDFIVSLVTGDFQGMRDAINNQMENIRNLISNIWNAIDSFFSKTLGGIWDTVKNIFNNIRNTISNVLGTIRNTISNIWNGIRNTISSVLNGIRSVITSVWNGIRSVITSVLNGIRSTVSAVWDGIRSVISSVVNGIRSVISSGFNAARSIVTSVVNGIRSVISSGFNAARSIVTSVVNGIRSVVSSVFGALSGIVSGAMGGVRGAISNGMSSALSAVTGIAGKFKDAGRKIVTSIADGIKGAVGSVTGAIGSIAGKIRNFLPFSPAKEGPLRDIMKTNIAGSIAETIERDENKALKAMQGMTGKLADEAELDLLSDIKGMTANSVLSGFIPNQQVIHQSIIANQSNQKRYDDSKVVQLLKQLIDKDGNVYINQEKVGSIMDKEQARRIKLLEGWVAID